MLCKKKWAFLLVSLFAVQIAFSAELKRQPRRSVFCSSLLGLVFPFATVGCHSSELSRLPDLEEIRISTEDNDAASFQVVLPKEYWNHVSFEVRQWTAHRRSEEKLRVRVLAKLKEDAVQKGDSHSFLLSINEELKKQVSEVFGTRHYFLTSECESGLYCNPNSFLAGFEVEVELKKPEELIHMLIALGDFESLKKVRVRAGGLFHDIGRDFILNESLKEIEAKNPRKIGYLLRRQIMEGTFFKMKGISKSSYDLADRFYFTLYFKGSLSHEEILDIVGSIPKTVLLSKSELLNPTDRKPIKKIYYPDGSLKYVAVEVRGDLEEASAYLLPNPNVIWIDSSYIFFELDHYFSVASQDVHQKITQSRHDPLKLIIDAELVPSDSSFDVFVEKFREASKTKVISADSKQKQIIVEYASSIGNYELMRSISLFKNEISSVEIFKE